ncbi:MAG: DUF4160 domain-containing protein [Pseudomonadota bacterium]
MPKVLEKYGIRFHFYGYDVQERAHIHASGQGGEAKVWLEPVELDHSQGLKADDVARIVRTVEEHQAEILEKWHDFKSTVS